MEALFFPGGIASLRREEGRVGPGVPAGAQAGHGPPVHNEAPGPADQRRPPGLLVEPVGPAAEPGGRPGEPGGPASPAEGRPDRPGR